MKYGPSRSAPARSSTLASGLPGSNPFCYLVIPIIGLHGGSSETGRATGCLIVITIGKFHLIGSRHRSAIQVVSKRSGTN